MLTSNWYWLLFAAVVLGEAAVFLFSEKEAILPLTTIWIYLWGISRR